VKTGERRPAEISEGSWALESYAKGVNDMYTSRPVIVMQLPEQLTHLEVGKFLSELQPLLESGCSRMVLDCSQVWNIDSAGVEMLLRCVQEAMKRDGDLKLAAVSPASGTIKELMRLDRLFETFVTNEEAVRSFHNFPSPVPQSVPGSSIYGTTADL
jgi:anti-anti-sigma factor